MSWRGGLLLVLWCCRGWADVSVLASGQAQQEDAAVQLALAAAIRQAAGVWLVSEQQAAKGRVVAQRESQYASGVVRDYQVLGCESAEGLVRCRVRATVSQQPLLTFAQPSDDGLAVSGKAAAGALVGRAQQLAGAHALLSALIDQPSAGVSVRAVALGLPDDSLLPASLSLTVGLSLDGDWLAQLSALLSRLEEDFAWLPPLPSGGVAVVRGWYVQRYALREVSLLQQIRGRLSQQQLGLALVWRDGGQAVLARQCLSVVTHLFGPNPVSVGRWGRGVLRPGTGNDPLWVADQEERHRLAVSLPVGVLAAVRSVQVQVGCDSGG
ncbi:hypothetical protein THUN1379_24660 [Paludibacterium sp. THUN1379]|uniref:hypothetical protein n=1 Tax=Paludibacterium sp. THUN1379 TaxID=3112107 RepID=UPI0030857245|nr:hypothetical protein THUN1379_24660 [Paludibacterium sp. THUN1379]